MGSAVMVAVVLAVVQGARSEVVQLSCSQVQAFVDGHNARRLQLARGAVPGQPAASEMKQVIWDEELAAKAAKWASNNKFAHNPNRTVASGRFGTGENIFIAGSTNMGYQLDVEVGLRSWFDEYKNYMYGPLKPTDFGPDKKAIGHYTQMAWSDSIYLGCGVSQWLEGKWKKHLVVCNYGPSGNYLGETPYSDGDAADKLVCGAPRQNCSRPYGQRC